MSDTIPGSADTLAGQLNTAVRLGFVGPEDRTHIRVVALRRGHGWTTSIVAQAGHPELFALLHQLLTGSDDVEVDAGEALLEELRAIGVWIAPDEVADDVLFSVPLDDEPTVEPGDAHATEDAGVIVNPSLSFAPPSHVDAAPGDAVWIADARCGITVPYAPGRLTAAVRACVPGLPPPPLDGDTYRQLRRAGVLTTAGDEQQAVAARTRKLEAATRAFAAQGYAIVPDLLPSAQLAAMRRYYRALIDQGCVRFGDRQVERRFAQHNERIARLFLTALTPVVATVVGAAVKPSYAYFASYREGASLLRHRDRAQCAFSISFLVDYTPTADGASPWPLWVARDPESAGTAVRQRIGDGIVYLGCQIYHWRDTLGPGQESTHLFLHYVGNDFDGELD